MSTREARHEAGHVVIAATRASLPLPHSVVTLGPTAGGHVAWWDDTIPLDDRGLTDLATQHLAGQAALLVFDYPDPGGGAEYDRQMAEGICKLLSPTGASALYVDLQRRTIALCREHRSAIDRFAQTLEANGGRLGGSEIPEAIEAAFRGWPSPRFDANGRLEFAELRRAHFNALIGEQQFAETSAGVSTRLAIWREADVAARAAEPVPSAWEAVHGRRSQPLPPVSGPPAMVPQWERTLSDLYRDLAKLPTYPRWTPTRAWRPQP